MSAGTATGVAALARVAIAGGTAAAAIRPRRAIAIVTAAGPPSRPTISARAARPRATAPLSSSLASTSSPRSG